MLANCWLLADLDGTLISTPHKAQGRYAPLMSSSCYKPLQRWIGHGGNVCVVTTADLRVMEQLYQPLRSCLGSFADYQRWRVEREGGSGTSTHNSTTKSQASSCGGVRHHPGTLLLSLYTGAVLYWCTSDRVCALPGYATILHCPSTSALEAWRQKSPTTTTSVSTTISSSSSSSSSLEGVCVRGTCISASTCREVVAIVEKIYYNFVEDLLRGDGAVMAALKMLSRRYRRMWLALLRYLHVAHTIMVEDKQPSSSSSSSSSMQECTSVEKLVAQDTAEQIAWKLKYLRKRPYFLLVLGIMRVEHVRASIAVGRPDHTSSSSSSSSAQQQSAIFTKERIMYCLEAEMSATQTTALHPYTERAAAIFMHLLGTQELSRSAASRAAHAQRKVADPLAHDDAMAAQIIVLGVPIALFSRYFRPHEACFMRGGVQCMAQPNSVVFAKLGINKSTALRYLLGLNPRTQDSINHHHHHKKKNDDDDDDGVPTFEAAVSSGLAVAMGDNPHLTDYELTVFADVAFISVEKTSQQQQRHERIRRRVQRTREAEVRGEQPLLPDGSPAPSSTALQDMMKRCGPMMDDRLCANIFYVGGEEDGTALFLSELLQQLHVPEESQCSTSSVVVSEQHFQRALRAAQTKAHSSVESSHILSKL